MARKQLGAILALALGLMGTGIQAMAGEADWPQFRGPDGQGNVPGSRAPLEWSETTGIRWKTPVPGRGWSSPVVDGDQIWLTTAIERPGGASAHVSDRALPAEVSLRAVCINRLSGKLMQNIELINVTDPNRIHALNSYASPTPVIEPGRLYCHFGRYGTVCVDTSDASVVWQREFPIEHYVGPGSSPIVHENLLILTCDGADKQFIVALDKRTGETVWRTDRPPLRSSDPDQHKSYCTPLVVTAEGVPQLIIPGSQWIVAYAPEDGREIWRVDHGRGFSVVPRPVAANGYLYCCTGFERASLVAIRLGGEGDVSQTHVKWSHQKQMPTQPSPILYGGRIYVISDNGIGQCLDAASGDVVWKKRLPGSYSASPLRVAERVYFFNRDGVTTVIETSDRGTELATNILDGTIMASPAVVDGQFILRTASHLYAIGD